MAVLPPKGYVHPEEILIDKESGYAYNVPLGLQMPPGWWLTDPNLLARILKLRADNNINIENDYTDLVEVKDEGWD